MITLELVETESIKNAGTQILKQLRKQAPIEWKKKYGDELTHTYFCRWW